MISEHQSMTLDTGMWIPFSIDVRGEMKKKRGEHELLSSMTMGEIVDEIVIDVNMDLQ